jgi:predicted butyrate kinase (DUF1464 family)
MFTPEMQMIDIDQAEIMLSEDIPTDLVEEYYRFGLAVLSEVQNMASQIEGKAIAILGLTSGLLVSLLFGTALTKDLASIEIMTELAMDRQIVR